MSEADELVADKRSFLEKEAAGFKKFSPPFILGILHYSTLTLRILQANKKIWGKT